jgi:hypothetical protein
MIILLIRKEKTIREINNYYDKEKALIKFKHFKLKLT